MRYFAYGSNMLTARLARRVRAPRPVTVARLVEHRLRFHKRGIDGSGKANALRTGDAGDLLYGVVFEIDPDDRPVLDGYEGAPLHYEAASVIVETGGGAIEVVTYRATPDFLADGLPPFSWYKALVLAGAREHGLPPDYVAQIAVEAETEDPDRARDEKERSVLPR